MEVSSANIEMQRSCEGKLFEDMLVELIHIYPQVQHGSNSNLHSMFGLSFCSEWLSCAGLLYVPRQVLQDCLQLIT